MKRTECLDPTCPCELKREPETCIFGDCRNGHEQASSPEAATCDICRQRWRLEGDVLARRFTRIAGAAERRSKHRRKP